MPIDPTVGKSQRLPKPASSVRGENTREPAGDSFEDVAKLYKPKNVGIEPPKATVARYALALINQTTGEALSAEDVGGTVDNASAVLHSPQTLTDEQKAQAVENLGLVLTRTAAQGEPVSDETLANVVVTGITNPVSSDPLRLRVAGTSYSSPVYELDDWQLQIINPGDDSRVWSLTKNGGIDFDATQPATEGELPPSSGWVVTTGVAASLEVEIDVTTPAFLGQKCIVGDTPGNYLEYTSLDGVTWTLTGPSNVRESTDTPGSIIGTTWSGDVPTWTLTTITDYLTA